MGPKRVVRGGSVERRCGAPVAELMALLPLVQLPRGVGLRAARLRGQTEVAEAVLGVLVLAKSGRGGAVARSPWQGPVCVRRCELVLGWWCSSWERVLSG